jgi:hypothetical protein
MAETIMHVTHLTAMPRKGAPLWQSGAN